SATSYDVMSRFDLLALTVFTYIHQVQIDSFLYAKYRFLKSQRRSGFDVSSALGALSTATAATKETLKDVAQSQIAQIDMDALTATSATAPTKYVFEPAKASPSSTASSADAGMTELIIALPFAIVSQDLIGF